ncbi:hypothetical protein TheetDRAFT_3212, partial [Thermoanaerobacter ethanolicus JW 200]
RRIRTKYNSGQSEDVWNYKNDGRRKRDEIVEMVEKICDNTAKAMGGEVEFKRTIGYPCLVNHKGMTDLNKRTAFPLLGEGNVIEVAPTMGVEDFAYFLQKVPGSFL